MCTGTVIRELQLTGLGANLRVHFVLQSHIGQSEAHERRPSAGAKYLYAMSVLDLSTFNTTFSHSTNEISVLTAGRNWNAMMIRGLGRSKALNIGLGIPVPAKWNENPRAWRPE